MQAPRSTRLKTFVWLSGIRWAIEQYFEETKNELGMDQYEVRKFAGWNHHILTCMLAHFFLWHLKIRLGKKAPAITLSQLRILLEVVLPLRTFDVNKALELVRGFSTGITLLISRIEKVWEVDLLICPRCGSRMT